MTAHECICGQHWWNAFAALDRICESIRGSWHDSRGIRRPPWVRAGMQMPDWAGQWTEESGGGLSEGM
jgi:hypothetical protein